MLENPASCDVMIQTLRAHGIPSDHAALVAEADALRQMFPGKPQALRVSFGFANGPRRALPKELELQYWMVPGPPVRMNIALTSEGAPRDHSDARLRPIAERIARIVPALYAIERSTDDIFVSDTLVVLSANLQAYRFIGLGPGPYILPTSNPAAVPLAREAATLPEGAAITVAVGARALGRLSAHERLGLEEAQSWLGSRLTLFMDDVGLRPNERILIRRAGRLGVVMVIAEGSPPICMPLTIEDLVA